METTLLIILIVLSIGNLLLQLKNKPNSNIGDLKDLKREFETLDRSMTKLESSMRDEFLRNREEMSRSSKGTREELNLSFKQLSDSLFSMMNELSKVQKNSLVVFSEQLSKSLKSFEERFSNSIDDFSKLQQVKFNELSEKQGELIKSTEEKLEKMRETVDEKLHKTLEERLGESFKLVSERLELVHKGLGEMQTLATGVGDLKKVLSNVKTRGIVGEIQLGAILEQILSKEQYDENVRTKKGSSNVVEYAVKLPGDGEDVVYLPIDAKFPGDTYAKLVDAYETGSATEIEEAGKELERRIKQCAKDIRDKYIDPPNTTEFGIMFLPFEGLYAEVVRRGMVEVLQREYKINIAGPTTMAALLNSLQMGFKTLAIQKRSSEVWNVLAAVKTEFDKFGTILEATQKKLEGASSDLDKLIGTRTKQIQRKLKSVTTMPEEESKKIIGVVDLEE